MARDPVASRYAQALFESVKADGRIDDMLEQLSFIGQLLRESPDLQRLLRNPDVDPEDKVHVLARVMPGRWSQQVQAFLRMVVAFGRAECLMEIAEAFRAAVDQDRGQLRVTVRSVRPLPETLLVRLRERLERREGKRVELTTELAPELLGGLQVALDHRLIDGSVRRQLDDLRQQLSAIRVH